MDNLNKKVDMAQMNAAIEKVLALPPTTQGEVKKRRAQRKSGHPPPAKSSKNISRPVAR